MFGRRIAGTLFCMSLLACLWAPAVHAAPGSSFTVEQIRVIGLERISKTTVLTYMPGIGVGQSVGSADIATAIRNLYGTG
ncbi:MAG: hypothetical protein ACRESG_07990, partial [Gammaproteobacteria bacterium]